MEGILHVFSKHCTTYQIQFHGQLLGRLGLREHLGKKTPTDLQLALSTLSHIFHASIPTLVPCNKAEIKRLAGQLLHNEGWREPLFFARGVVGLQRMW